MHILIKVSHNVMTNENKAMNQKVETKFNTSETKPTKPNKSRTKNLRESSNTTMPFGILTLKSGLQSRRERGKGENYVIN